MESDEFDLGVVASIIGVYLLVNFAQLIQYIVKVRRGLVASRLIFAFKAVKCLAAFICIANLWDIKECLKAERRGIV